MKHYFLPVFGWSRFVASRRIVYGATDANKWWDGPPLNYAHGLISYVHWKQPFQFPKDAYIFGDSGGFTLVANREHDRPGRGGHYSSLNRSRHGPLDAEMVLEWQESLCSVGAILDRPPRKGWEHGQEARIWGEAMKMTQRFMRLALPRYERDLARGTKFRWWGVLHGNSEDEIVEWHRACADIYPFTGPGEGWAIRAEPTVNMFSCARSVRVLERLGIKRTHFLAATGQDVTAVILALCAKAGLEVVSYDSATATKMGANRQIQTVESLGSVRWRILREEDDDQRVQEFLWNTCECPCCAHMRLRPEAKSFQTGKWGGFYATWAQLHNQYAQQMVTENQFQAALQDPDAMLKDVLEKDDYFKVLRSYDGRQSESVVTGTARDLLSYL